MWKSIIVMLEWISNGKTECCKSNISFSFINHANMFGEKQKTMCFSRLNNKLVSLKFKYDFVFLYK